MGSRVLRRLLLLRRAGHAIMRTFRGHYRAGSEGLLLLGIGELLAWLRRAGLGCDAIGRKGVEIEWLLMLLLLWIVHGLRVNVGERHLPVGPSLVHYGIDLETAAWLAGRDAREGSQWSRHKPRGSDAITGAVRGEDDTESGARVEWWIGDCGEVMLAIALMEWSGVAGGRTRERRRREQWQRRWVPQASVESQRQHLRPQGASVVRVME